MMTEVLTLDAVAQELLGIGKIGIKWKEIEESWRMKKDVERIAEYALRDAELTLKLSEHLLPQIFSLSRLTGLLPFDVTRYTYSQLVESFLMRKAIETNVLLPNHPKSDEIERRRMRPVYKGALVVEPKKGIHSDILVFDFASLYPTIICTHNISPETLNCEHEECKKNNKVPELNYHFCQKRKGFIPTHLEELIKKRREIKDEMKKVEKDSLRFRELSNLNQAIKTIANAMYGYFSFFSARWYSVECGAASASFGRYYITKVLEMAKECFEIIYSDTDSAMLRMKSCDASTKREELIKKAGEFVEKVNEELPGMIELEFRGLYEGGIFIARRGEEKGAKKRYALIDYEGNLEVRGFEVRRGDWCQLAKKTQEEVLRAIMRDKSPEKAIRIVRDSIKKIRDGKASIDELVIYTQLVKPLSAYEQIGPHVKAAMKMRDKGRPIGEGMIVAYVITKGTGSISDRAFPVEDVKEGDYDPDYYVNNQVLPAAMRVLQALEITEEQVLSGRIQASLGEWFKR
jgi:DNA polymerase I/DNA polymerase-2